MAGSQDSTPDKPSVAEKLTVTLELFQPCAFAEGDAAAEATGAVLSMLMPETLAEAEFPARSVQLRLTCCDAPSVETTAAGSHVWTPERPSVAATLTVTSVLFQPCAFASGARDPVTSGAVLSILTTGETKLALLPARSVTLTLPETEEPSALSTSGLAILVASTPDRLSDAVKAKWTSLLFQPLTLAAGLAPPKLSDGAVLSMLMPERLAGALFPALSTQLPE